MRRLARFLKPYKKQVILGPFFKLLEAVFELIIPTLMTLVIDNGIRTGNKPYIYRTGALMLLIATLGMIFAFICQYLAAQVSQGFGTIVRNELFMHIGTFSYKEIDKFGTPSLINRITNDVNQLQLAVAMLIRLVIRAPFLCIGGLAMSMILDVKLSLIILIILPLFAIILYIVMSKSIPLYKSVQGKLDRLSLILRENLTGVRVIRAFSQSEHEKKRFLESNNNYADTAIKVGRISALMNPLTSIIINFSIIAILWFGGIRVNIGGMTQGEIVAFINYVIQILSALIIVANLIVLFTKASASAARVNEILDTQSSVKDKNRPIDIVDDKINTSILEFKDVSFKYEGDKDYSLKNISFTINKGETIGIIGGTGSGKSTLINLIPRFYDTSKGEVLFKGENVKNYNQKELRRKIGLVPQKATLFTGSISSNISFGLEDFSEENIKKAAKIAQISDYIEGTGEKYSQLITKGGGNLSGGQKQRLTIARALAKDPEILILDDSFTALDFSTDAALRKAIKDNTNNMTVIMISQRVSTIKNSDKIIVLDDGEMVGLGTHENLIESCEVYKEICMSQLNREVR